MVPRKYSMALKELQNFHDQERELLVKVSVEEWKVITDVLFRALWADEAKALRIFERIEKQLRCQLKKS